MVVRVHDENQARRTPVLTYALIALCAAVFLLGPVSGFNPSYGSGDRLACAQAVYFDQWGVIPAELFHGRASPGPPDLPAGCEAPGAYRKSPLLSVFSALFVHGSWLHLLGNLLFLHVFGDDVENRLGRTWFVVLFLAAGCLATLGFALAHPGSRQALIGASGAVSGVLGSYLFLCPKARVTSLFPFLFFLPLRLPAWMVLGFWFVLQGVAARTGRSGPGVAYLAHVVGFAFGFLCTWVWFRRRHKLRNAARASQGDLQP